MLQTVEAEYENGKIRLLEKPKVKKAHAIVTFLPSEGETVSIDGGNAKKIDWKKVRAFKGHAKKWLGCVEGVDVSRLREEKADYILEKNK